MKEKGLGRHWNIIKQSIIKFVEINMIHINFRGNWVKHTTVICNNIQHYIYKRGHLFKPVIPITFVYFVIWIQASTLEIWSTIYNIAVQLGDEKLLVKLTSTDYHKRCYVSFRARGRSDERQSCKTSLNDNQSLVYGTVLAKLVEYIKNLYIVSDISPVLKLSQLTNRFEKRTKSLGFENYSLYITKLKDELLLFVPGLKVDRSGWEVLFLSKKTYAAQRCKRCMWI